jgi:hypothetical protein
MKMSQVDTSESAHLRVRRRQRGSIEEKLKIVEKTLKVSARADGQG